MYTNVSDEFKEIVKSNAITASAKLVFDSLGITIEGQATDALKSSLSDISITDKCYNSGQLIGTTMAKEVEINIKNKDNLDLADEDFALYVGVKLSSGKYEYIPYGNYIVTEYEDTKSNDIFKIIAYDYMTKFNIDYVNTSEYPISLKNFKNNLCLFCGVDIEDQDLPNDDFEISESIDFEGATCRTILSKIAELQGSFVKINRDNKVQFYLKTETDEKIDAQSMNSSLGINNQYGPVNVVSFTLANVEGENVTLRDDASIEKYGETTIEIQDNPFVYTQALRESAIEELYNRLNGFTYIPTKFKWKARLYLDCGDAIQVQNVQEETETYVDSMILNQSIKIPATRKSELENEALTKTQVTNQYISKTEQLNRHTELRVDKTNQTITGIITRQDSQEDITNNLSLSINTLSNTITSMSEQNEQSISELKNSIEGISAIVSKVGGNNLIKNSDMANDTNFWLKEIASPYVESDSVPTDPTEGLYWYCTENIGSYVKGQMYIYTDGTWETSEITRKYLDNNNNLLQYTSSYENEDTRQNTISGRMIKFDLSNSEDFGETHIFNVTNISEIKSDQKYISYQFKIKNNIKTGIISFGFAFLPIGELETLEVTDSLYEPSLVLTPDDYTNQLYQYEKTLEMVYKSDFIPVTVSDTEPTDTTVSWMDTNYNMIKEYDTESSSWLIKSNVGQKNNHYMTAYDSETGEIWVYRGLYSSYYKTSYIYDDIEIKSVVCIFSFYGGFYLDTSTSEPTPAKGMYWLDSTNDKVWRAKYRLDSETKESTFVEWEDTGISVTYIINHPLPMPPFPVQYEVFPTGYYEIADLKVEYNDICTIWNRYENELYSKNFKVDEKGLHITSGQNEMFIDEDEIVALYNNTSIFKIQQDLSIFERTQTNELDIPDFKFKVITVGGTEVLTLT